MFLKSVERWGRWACVSLKPDDFCDLDGKALTGWENLKELRFEAEETLRPRRGSNAKQGDLVLNGKVSSGICQPTLVVRIKLFG